MFFIFLFNFLIVMALVLLEKTYEKNNETMKMNILTNMFCIPFVLVTDSVHTYNATRGSNANGIQPRVCDRYPCIDLHQRKSIYYYTRFFFATGQCFILNINCVSRIRIDKSFGVVTKIL